MKTVTIIRLERALVKVTASTPRLKEDPTGQMSTWERNQWVNMRRLVVAKNSAMVTVIEKGIGV